MHQHPGSTSIATADASMDAESRPRPFLSFLLDLGVIATFAVAMLALIAMVNPAFADGASPLPAAERPLIGACP